jgi:hypothetical protein
MSYTYVLSLVTILCLHYRQTLRVTKIRKQDRERSHADSAPYLKALVTSLLRHLIPPKRHRDIGGGNAENINVIHRWAPQLHAEVSLRQNVWLDPANSTARVTVAFPKQRKQ